MNDSKATRKTYNRILKNWETNNIKSELYLTHCISSYQVPDKDANLKLISNDNRISKCKNWVFRPYKWHRGLFNSCKFRAKIIEKHFTIDKNYSDFRDHQLSSDTKIQNLVEKLEKLKI